MERFVLIARPHGNIRQQLWKLKREAFDWNRDDASVAMPEGFICGWFDASKFSTGLSKSAFSEHVQRTLTRYADEICAVLPDTFRFSSAIEARDRIMLKLDDELDIPKLKVTLERFAQDAGLEPCADALTPDNEAYRGIWLGSGTISSAPFPLSFKKYELVLYLAKLPETPFSGFQFRTVARIHRKTKAHPRTERE